MFEGISSYKAVARTPIVIMYKKKDSGNTLENVKKKLSFTKDSGYANHSKHLFIVTYYTYSNRA